MRCFVIAAAAALLALPALAQVDKATEKELRASYGKVIAAMKKKDAKGVVAQMTPDATMKEMGQTLTRAQFESMLPQQLAMIDVQSADIAFSRLTVKNGLANADYTETMKAKLKSPDGKSSNLETVAKYHSVFKKMGSEWKIKSSEMIGKPDVKVNGKPMTMQGGAGPRK
jgi:ketosteroid isomerase-like protein